MMQMTWKSTIVGAVFAFVLISQLNGASVKLIKEFDSGSEDFFFQRIRGLNMSKNRDIYVLDGKGCFLAKYDWNGKIIKKIGKRGAGPGDFYYPASLSMLNNKLLFLDGMNKRIAEVDLELNHLKYHKIHSGDMFSGDFFVMGNNKCVGKVLSYSIDYRKEYKIIKIMDYKTQAELMFFDKVPVKSFEPGRFPRKAVLTVTYSPCIGIDRENKKLIVSFTYPNNPIEFFIYSFDGQCDDQFSYVFDENYKYPDHYKTGDRAPKKFIAVILHDIHVYKGNYIMFVSNNRFTNFPVFKQEQYCLIFDAKSKQVKHRFRIPDHLVFHYLSPDGYLLGTKEFQDDVKVFVYKLEL